ncbi:MAG: protein kinase [Gemmatimonadota bacterium]|nr:MAG: protein kinase [Gemmatimonadota bacterium]
MMNNLIGKAIGHYKILEKLGEGGMGVVYKAEDTKLKRIVALKFLSPELTNDLQAKERFIQEAQTSSAIEHTNICNIYEIDETKPAPGEPENGQIFIVMAYYDGETLEKKIQRGPLTLEDALQIAIQVSEGLKEAHDMAIIHRDIKPANIMETAKGQVKIMDFGLAKLKSRARITKAGTTSGTLAYSSPEQVSSKKLDHRSDIFSFGIVLYELLTGRHPFQGDYEAAIVYSILNENPEPVSNIRPDVPKALVEIIQKTLAKIPDNRYQSMNELLIDLKRVKQDFESGPSPKRDYQFGERKRIRKVLWGIVPVILLAIFFVIITKIWIFNERKTIVKIPIGVMFFENQTGENKYDYLRKVLADMLITDLNQSRFMQAMTFESMFDLMKSLGYEDATIIDASMGAELCGLAGARFMVLGGLSKSGNTFVVNAQVLDVETKSQVRAFRVTGKGEGSILGHLVDDLTDKIKSGMEIPLKEIQKEKMDITKHMTTSLEAYEYYFAGREAAIRMNHQEAIDNLEKAVALDSTFIEAYDALARHYYSIKEREKALETIEKLKSLSGKCAERKLIEILALEAFINHDWDLAIQYYKKLIRMNPEDIVAHIDLGIIYYQKKLMHEEGISEFEKVLELDRKGALHYSNLTSMEKERKLYNIYLYLGYAYMRKGEVTKAHAAFREYVGRLPHQFYPLIVLGDFYLITGNYDEAIVNFQRSLEINPENPLTSKLLGEAYLAKGMYNQALSFFKKSLDLSLSKTDKADAHFHMGKQYYLKCEYPQAILDCRHALELDSTLIEAHWVQGLILVKNKEFEKAESEVMVIKELIEKTKTEDPKTYYYQLSGELFLGRGLHKQAVENFKRASNINTLDRTFFMCALGEAYLKIGELNKAEETLRDVFNINPSYAQAYYLLGRVYEKKRKNEEARRHFQKFIEIWKDADEDIAQLKDARKKLETS